MTHKARAHALLGASGADRWINCPPSARQGEHMAEKSSEYAKAGTVAHELSELHLRRRLLPCNAKQREELEAQIKTYQTNHYYNVEMERAVNDYIAFVEKRFIEIKSHSGDVRIQLEERLDYTEWVPEGFGTGDVVLVADGVMEIIDLKYGKGVPVRAEGNTQLRLYALGAWGEHNWLYSIDEVHMTIVQPRLDNISTATLSIDELLEWAENIVKPAAALAYAGKGEYQPGSHCRWCKIKGNCRARADENMKAIAHEFQDPARLSYEEIGSILFIAEKLKNWATDVEHYAFEQAKAGKPIPQWKLVEGRSNRIITDKEQATKRLLDAGFEDNNLFKPRELEGLSKLEKQIRKKELADILTGLITKPVGKPVLVPETDKRPALNSVETDFTNIDMEVY